MNNAWQIQYAKTGRKNKQKVTLLINLFDGGVHRKLISFLFGLTEDNSATMAATVDLNHITNDGCPLRPVTRYGQVLWNIGEVTTLKETALIALSETESIYSAIKEKQECINAFFLGVGADDSLSTLSYT